MRHTIDGYRFHVTRAGWREVCRKCGGSGDFPSLLNHGRCNPCQGGGLIGPTLTEHQARARVARRQAAQARRQAAAQAKAAAEQAALTTWQRQNTTLLDALAPHRDSPTPDGYTARVLTDLAQQANNKPLTERQADLARNLLAEHAEHQTNTAATRHAGVVGEHITITGTLATLRAFDGAYGLRVTIVIEGTGPDAGVTAVTFLTPAKAKGLTEGQPATITGTVKRHDHRHGVAQTILTRATVTP